MLVDLDSDEPTLLLSPHIGEEVGVAILHVSKSILGRHRSHVLLQLRWAHGRIPLEQEGSRASCQRRGHRCPTHDPGAGVVTMASTWNAGSGSIDVQAGAIVAERGSIVTLV